MPISQKKLLRGIEIPSDVTLEINNNNYKFKGKKGEAERILFAPNVKITRENNIITVAPNVKKPTKKEKRAVNTIKSHIQNLITGVKEGFVYKLKVCSGHFPMTVSIEKDNFIIKNFLGEKIPRKTKILEGAKVKIEGDVVVVEGNNIERVGQTAANIENATRITDKDRRKFQDGIHMIEKEGIRL